MLQTLKDFGYINEYNSFIRRMATNSRVNSDNSYVDVDIRGIEKLEYIRSDSSLLTMFDGSTLQIGLEPVKLIGIYKLYNLILTNHGYKNCFSDKIQLSSIKDKQSPKLLQFNIAVLKLVTETKGVYNWSELAKHLVSVTGESGLIAIYSKDVWLVRPHPSKDHGLLVFTDRCLHIDMPLKHFLMGVNDQDFVLVKKNTWLRSSLVSHLTTYKDHKGGNTYLDINLTNGKFVTVSRRNKAGVFNHFVNKPVIKL